MIDSKINIEYIKSQLELLELYTGKAQEDAHLIIENLRRYLREYECGSNFCNAKMWKVNGEENEKT